MNKYQKQITRLAKAIRRRELQYIEDMYKESSKGKLATDALLFIDCVCEIVDAKTNKHFKNIKRGIVAGSWDTNVYCSICNVKAEYIGRIYTPPVHRKCDSHQCPKCGSIIFEP